MIKTDNGHGPLAHSPQMPLYSTLFLISKLGIMIVPLINLRALVNTTHVTIKQKDWVFGHGLSPLWYHDALFLLYVGPHLLCQLPIQGIHARHFCQKPQLTSPGSKQC